jgi:hypothetical protein
MTIISIALSESERDFDQIEFAPFPKLWDHEVEKMQCPHFTLSEEPRTIIT